MGRVLLIGLLAVLFVPWTAMPVGADEVRKRTATDSIERRLRALERDERALEQRLKRHGFDAGIAERSRAQQSRDLRALERQRDFEARRGDPGRLTPDIDTLERQKTRTERQLQRSLDAKRQAESEARFLKQRRELNDSRRRRGASQRWNRSKR